MPCLSNCDLKLNWKYAFYWINQIFLLIIEAKAGAAAASKPAVPAKGAAQKKQESSSEDSSSDSEDEEPAKVCNRISFFMFLFVFNS